MIVRRPKSARRLRGGFDQSGCCPNRRTSFKRKVWLQILKTHPLEISMDHALAVHIDQSPCDVAQLWELHDLSAIGEEYRNLDGERTISNQFVSWRAPANRFMFPFDIHSDTIENSVSVIITPRSGNTFVCRRVFHDTDSPQNLCTIYGQRPNGYVGNEECDQQPTWMAFCRSLVSDILNLLTATSRP
jgi:hypothetical protein